MQLRHLLRSISAVLLGAAAAWAGPASAAVVIGATEVTLDGRRSQVRTVETNLGNLSADAFLWQARQSGFQPAIGFVNGGLVRGDQLFFSTATAAAPADVDTDFPVIVNPFGWALSVIEDVSVNQLLLALENSVSGVSGQSFDGRFLQIAGFRYSWDTAAAAGSRIIDAFLDNGTQLIDDGTVVSSLLLDIATSQFVAQGGDGYAMLTGGAVQDTGVLDRDALAGYIRTALSGRINASDYALGGNERIFRNTQLVPEPSTLALIGASVLALAATRRRPGRAGRSASQDR
jgi:5'-nucleotidase/UDP-sugar diphosphatase